MIPEEPASFRKDEDEKCEEKCRNYFFVRSSYSSLSEKWWIMEFQTKALFWRS